MSHQNTNNVDPIPEQKKRLAETDPTEYAHATGTGRVSKKKRLASDSTSESSSASSSASSDERSVSTNGTIDETTSTESISDSSYSSDDADRLTIVVEQSSDVSNSGHSGNNSSSHSDSDEPSEFISDYDICRARYMLLYDKECGGALEPAMRATYQRQLNDSVWGPLTSQSFELSGADRNQVFMDYAQTTLYLLLPFTPSTKAVRRMAKALKF